MVAQFHESCNIKQDYVGMVEFIDVVSFEVVNGWMDYKYSRDSQNAENGQAKRLCSIRDCSRCE